MRHHPDAWPGRVGVHCVPSDVCDATADWPPRNTVCNNARRDAVGAGIFHARSGLVSVHLVSDANTILAGRPGVEITAGILTL